MAADNPVQAPDIRFTLEPIADPDALGARWRALEERADASLFQSWGWIGAWLASLPAAERPSLLAGTIDGRCVALATLGRRTARRHGWLVSRGLYLNQTGSPAYDGLTIEYNGILAERGLEAQATASALAHAVRVLGGWDELFLSGVDAGARERLVAAGLDSWLIAEQPVDYVDLAALRSGRTPYIDRLSRNSRYQLRRALRRYAERGALEATAAGSAGEALEWLAELKVLHQAYWVGRGRPGSFANPYFETFHTAFIRDRFDHGEVELLRIRAGAQTIGCLYNFLHRGRVYGYQSGFRYEDDATLKPGLVSHYLAIERHLAGGAAIYDFMAGAGQHKHSLSTASGTMLWLSGRRRRFRFAVEDFLRNLKRSVIARRSADQPRAAGESDR